MYRPKGFPTFSDVYVPPMPESFNTIFNWGADAMLEGLKKEGQFVNNDGSQPYGLVLGRSIKRNEKGYLVFIPEEIE